MLRIALRSPSFAWVVLLCAARLAGAEPGRLTVQPAALELDGPVARHGILVSAAAGDVTAAAHYASQDPQVVTVSPTGECLAQRDGRTQIVVTYDGRTVPVPVTVRDSGRAVPPSFLNDVVPLLTRLGCNQGACHGKGAGQNGFRLSLRGYAPEWDHAWLTRECDGRRVSTAAPEDSLLLRKPLGLVPHEGGKLLSRGSRGHRLLLDWLRAGAPGPAADPEVRSLEILPGDRTLRVGQGQPLLARAEFADGRWKDVTWLTRFDSTDPAVAEVDAGGQVHMRRPGAGSVRAGFMGLVAVATFTAPYDQTVRPEALAARNNFIDDHVFAKLADLHIEPSGLCSDETFLRRASLDTIGTLPTPAEVRAFLADRRPDRRARLIDDLLGRPEFVDFWAQQLGDLLQNRKESDHDVRGAKGVRSFHEWLRRQVAANRPWDELARDVLTATGPVTDNPAVGYFIVTVGEHAQADQSAVVGSVAQAFLGTRVGCAQCHNHPLERYTQDDYYHFTGFFSRVKLERRDPLQGPTRLVVSAPDPNQNKNPVGVIQPRTGQFLAPRPLDRSALTVRPDEDPRVKLAAWVTDPGNEYFSGAMVNRLWQHFLGVGLVEPVDDLRASNPPSNPALWRALNREFVAHRCDLKHIMRLILNSRTYQLAATTLPANEHDTRFYSHYYVRRLPAEVLLDAIAQATGVSEAFPGYPVGLRAQQLPDPGLTSYFLSLFGRPERTTACACERTADVTMPQLLHLYGGDTVGNKVRAGEGRLAALLKGGLPDDRIAEELFLATLSRPPAPAEIGRLHEVFAAGGDRGERLRDLFWALLNSKEFAFNH
jgi:hypothetical protein